MNKHIKVLGIFVLALSLIIGCSEQSAINNESSPDIEEKSQEENPNKEVNEESKDESKEEPNKELNVFKIGETADVSDIKVTVTSIEPYTGEMRQFRSLKQDHAVKVGVIFKNTMNSKIYPNIYAFTMFDVEGNKLQPACPSGKTNLDEELPPGKKVKGAFYFDVPVQEGVWKLKYSSFVNFGESAVWEVPAK
ncbi:DUF4352 domain-containing protein [Virgibacillus doumboii]|uniref:DUF4352 domain-containing protein n=1 Tax=Virgibacillus doumboii TaxID=2697503 RepID=UPI0013DE7C67|nr:DUF4352 domain-containing protein [Virgibacillus doumboii]